MKKHYKTKVAYILPMYLAIAVLCSAVLWAGRWLLTLKYHVLNWPIEVWELWLPLGLPLVALIIWFRPRLAILNFNNDNAKFGLLMLAGGGLMISTAIQQHFFTTATGKLVAIEHVADISKQKPAQYYALKNRWINWNYGGTYTDFRTSGKYNQDFNITVYFVYPLISSSTEAAEPKPTHWFGKKFSKRISNRLSNEEKENLYQAFYEESFAQLSSNDLNRATYFERLPKSAQKDNYLKAIEARLGKPADEHVVVLEPKYAPFANRNGNKLRGIFIAFGFGIAALLLFLIWPDYDAKEHQRLQQGGKAMPGDLEDMLQFLVPEGEHFATSIILDLMILVYLVMVFSGVHPLSPNGEELLLWGANLHDATAEGQWWRLITCVFLHGGIMHLALNSVGLVMGGILIENLLGRKNYFILFGLAGICGSLTSFWWHDNTISVGASGAIFGLYGAAIALLLANAYPKREKKSTLIWVSMYVVLTLVQGLTGGIDNAAHLGGLISGACIGWLLYKLFPPTKK